MIEGVMEGSRGKYMCLAFATKAPACCDLVPLPTEQNSPVSAWFEGDGLGYISRLERGSLRDAPT